MSIIAIIPARGESKSVQRKNIKLLAGKPLIAYTIETALKCKLLNRVIVSTDDKEIAAISKKHGAEVPFMRSRELALDSTPMLPVLQHAVSYMEQNEKSHIDVVVLLQPTSPFRKVSDIENCIKKLKNEKTDSVVTVCEAEHNPYFVMMKFQNDNLVPFLKTEKPITRRQDAPKVYRLNGAVYAVRRDVLMNENKLFTDNTKAVIMPQERSIDLDSQLDFEFAELLLKKRGHSKLS
jgi:N-acylneuraminate cytidylyltransferase/CMP-N,N'-diacetyllegionaminic acid synthase